MHILTYPHYKVTANKIVMCILKYDVFIHAFTAYLNYDRVYKPPPPNWLSIR